MTASPGHGARASEAVPGRHLTYYIVLCTLKQCWHPARVGERRGGIAELLAVADAMSEEFKLSGRAGWRSFMQLGLASILHCQRGTERLH